MGKTTEISELRDGEDVCILSNSRGASMRDAREELSFGGGGSWSRWAGREEASVTDSKRGKEQGAARSPQLLTACSSV